MAIEAHAEHVVRCIFCSSEHVAGNVNEAGKWYGYCLCCGGRFWDNGPEIALVKNP